MTDGGLRAYIEAIEAHLTRLRGVSHTLMGPELGLARTWHAGGVTLATVLAGIDRAQERVGSVGTLSICRRSVEDVLASGADRHYRKAPEPALPELSTASRTERQRALAAALGNLPQNVAAPLQQQLSALVAAIEMGTLHGATCDARCAMLDAAVTQAALGALPETVHRQLAEEADRAGGRARGRVSDEALADARARLIAARAREHFGLPRLCG